MPGDEFNFEDLGRVLAEQNNQLMKQWADQVASLSQTFKQSHMSQTQRYNGIKLPKFSGNADEDVVEFITNFERAANFYKWEESRKTEALPLHLDVQDVQFHSDSDRWLLRQKLSERKQLPTETVTDYAADVRRMCRRVDVPTTESISFFIQGLNPETKRYVISQRPETLEEAEDQAKLKESVAEPKPGDRTDEILRAVAKLQIAQAPNVAVCEFDSAAPNVRENTRDNRRLDRSEITQIIRQELRRANGFKSTKSGQPK